MNDQPIPTRTFVVGVQQQPGEYSSRETLPGTTVRLHDGTADNHIGYDAGPKLRVFAEYIITAAGQLEIYSIRHDTSMGPLHKEATLVTTYAAGGWLSVSGSPTSPEAVS